MLRRLLLLPMTLALFLLASIVAARVDVARSNASAESIGAYYDALRARGLDIDQTKPLILSRLEASLVPEKEAESLDHYWSAEVQYQLALSGAQTSIWVALVELYGLEAMNDPAFRRIFRPLHLRFGSVHRECIHPEQ